MMKTVTNPKREKQLLFDITNTDNDNE